MIRSVVKVRTVGDTLVITLPKSVLESSHIHAGDRVMVEATSPVMITVTKEGKK